MPASAPNPTSSSASAPRRLASRTVVPLTTSGTMTLSSAVRIGRRKNVWNTKPTVSLRKRESSASSIRSRWRPPTSTSPDVGVSSPPTRLSTVVLPVPLRPTSATKAPSSITWLQPSSTRTVRSPSRYSFVTRRASIIRSRRNLRTPC